MPSTALDNLDKYDGASSRTIGSAPSSRFALNVVAGRGLDDLPKPEWLIEGLLERDSIAMLYGPSGSGKSFLAIDLALSISTGRESAAGPASTGPVLYIAAEGVGGLRVRQDAWLTHHSLSDAENLSWQCGAVNLLDEHQVRAVVQFVRENGVVLIVIDTLHRCSVGADENNAKDAGLILSAANDIRQAGERPCVLLVHHSGKETSRGARGSSALKAGVDTELELSGQSKGLTLKVTKQKNHESQPPISLRLEPRGASAVVVADQVGAAQSERTLLVLQGLTAVDDGSGATYTSWSNYCQDEQGIATSTFDQAKAAAARAGLVAQEGPRKPWKLTEQGIQLLGESVP